jgi:hypothetical protein
LAQVAGDRSDAGTDADDARIDALFGTLDAETPQPYGTLYATAPDAAQQVARPQFQVNGLLPLGYDSNPLERGSGSDASWGAFPVANVSAAAPLGDDLPFRVTVSARSEFRRFFDDPAGDVNRLTFSGRVQYVDPTDDQALSPYIAITPRFSYLPAFVDQTEARQDFNFGFSKSFHFDQNFRLVPAASNTSAETVWSFGVTAFAQRRFRQPQLSSDALFLVPSIAWKISQNWNASLALELRGRWFEPNALGATRHDWDTLPIATVEYILPASLFGSATAARLLGSPAIDFQASRLDVWSTAPGASYDQWVASATLKMGWRF